MEIFITDIDVKDVRFPTSLLADGSDAMHTDPDYSCAYVTLKTNKGIEGYGLTFTLGRGTEIVVQACKSMSYLVKGQKVTEIFANFGSFWRKLTSETQLRWLGPEKGVTHLATAAIINALWDLWARLENKPVWKLLVDLTPEQLVSTIDFRYITDVITKEEVIKMLKESEKGKTEREELLKKNGYPAYTTQVGWLGYSDEKMKTLCKKFLDLGFTSFKAKVGQNLKDDIRRCKLIREMIGNENKLMVDANQIWDVNESIEWMKELEQFKPIWIEEPTSPDDILGHAKIAEALRPHGIGVATGEMCANRVIFKQLLQAKAIDYCQIDSARIGGINEILAVYFMCKKLGVPVCPHAGGIGLCEMVQHLQMWDFVSLSGSTDDRVIEYVDQQHEYFEHPVRIHNACYMPPMSSGYSTKLKDNCIKNYIHPDGIQWKQMYEKGLFQKISC
ncbi:PREDICTED: mitochondrial enolase superfamily member 1-like [Dufourea novaeangliae]|uniref:Mitochondrial enolase superfamily member 1 n=1 Tax=Dufourea novaeangliae TaxID=178035 RepID=A0A154PQK6_DUFNO|nr:PREDICTED: mitochondrial enolase superfamily member 1-like [Dufourea novaeangliae]KZC13538.1 Mitochondrial enolase superfamily member 1 [Dufourea novaeangliae]